MHFAQTLRYFQKHNARNIMYMAVLILGQAPRAWIYPALLISSISSDLPTDPVI